MKHNKGRNILCALIAMLVFFYACWACFAAGEETADEYSYSGPVNINSPDAENEDKKLSSQIKYRDHFSFDVRILTYGIIQEPAESSQNPGNNLINLPHYIANLDVRPDVYFNSSVVDISAKPRAKLYFRAWEDGDLKGETKWDDDWYVNEWLVRIKAGDRLFVSYGRENLQWGPSFLYSPSNPFFSDNGRSNPYMEIPGMDFGRLIFIPNRFWTISLIVNTDEGRNILPGPDPFVNTYAVKIDFTGRQNYASLILSQRDDKNYNPVLGFFGGWTVSDAILLYGEGSLTEGSQALYPQGNILWASMQRIHGDDSDIKPVLLAGGSYTFYNGGTLTLEYMHNAPGYNKDEADLYYEFRRDAACLFNMGGIAGFIGKYFLSQTGNPGLRFLRKNYVMLQYYHGNIKDKFDMTLRWTQNIDDGSGQFLGLLSYSAGNHWALFSSGAINVGNADTEFGSILNYQFMLGLKFVF